MKRLLPFSLVALVLLAACKPRVREATPLQQKQAANLVSEAQFALGLRDYARAEPLYAQATDLVPAEPNYWVSLGSARVHLGNKAGAKKAYEGALDAVDAAIAKDGKASEPRLQRVYVLALLGRADDARSALAKAQRDLPDDRAIRGFAESKQLDQLLADPGFKAIAL